LSHKKALFCFLKEKGSRSSSESTLLVEGFKKEEIVEVKEKLVHLERRFDVREGIRRENDTVSRRFLTQKVDSGKYKGVIIDEEKFERMKDFYYQKRGWDIKTGVLTRKTLERVGLGRIAEEFDGLGIC
jgi:aldehyde:ferredoxin oxidoreductase